MSIFWNLKDNDKKNGDDSNHGETFDNKINNSQIKKRSESFLRFDDLDLDNIHIRNDVLLEIATFLSRRWSHSTQSTIHISREGKISTNLDKKRIILPGLDYFYGNIFQKYRQWRTLLWYESVRLRYSFKIFDTDVVFGFVFNILETKRIEILSLIHI